MTDSPYFPVINEPETEKFPVIAIFGVVFSFSLEPRVVENHKVCPGNIPEKYMGLS